MKMIKKIAFVCVLVITGFVDSSSAESITLDPEIFNTINSMIAEVRQKTMNELYSQAPQRDKMREEMQMKYGSKAYLRAIFRPRQYARTQAMFHAGAFVRKRMIDKPIPMLPPQNGQ
jgi:hypothetical protein